MLAFSVISKVRGLIAQNNLIEAVNFLLSILKNETAQKDLIILKRQLSSLEEKQNRGKISLKAVEIEKNIISDSLLQIINRQVVLPEQTRPIKGLKSFERADELVFKKLQRSTEISEYSDSIIHGDFKIGILFGTSGVGKTSFLKAGLIPELEKENHEPIYLKLTNEDPIISISRIFAERTNFGSNFFSQETDFQLLEKQFLGKRIVLILDQFEQFITQQNHLKTPNSLIDFLLNWKTQNSRIKILISIRGDFVHHLYKFQALLKFHLIPGINYFEIKKFTPVQASKIFSVFANSQRLPIDESFISEMCRDELSSKDDGLITAVDIQILALMLNGQTDLNSRAFNKIAYERLGGIEGLLRKYLLANLDTKSLLNKNQGGLKTLLAFIDTSSYTISGIFTTQEIITKLKGQLEPERIQDILSWLCEVRLLNKQDRDEGTIVYELAHERLIQPIIGLSGKILGPVDKASQLLDRRYHLWVWENKARIRLLNGIDFLKIKRFSNHLTWGKHKEQKLFFLIQSEKRIKRRFVFYLVLLALFTLPLTFFSTDLGRISWLENYVLPELTTNSNSNTLGRVSLNLFKYDPQYSIKILALIKKGAERKKYELQALDSINPSNYDVSVEKLVAKVMSDSRLDTNNHINHHLHLIAIIGETQGPKELILILDHALKDAKEVKIPKDKSDVIARILNTSNLYAKKYKSREILAWGQKTLADIESPFPYVESVISLSIASSEVLDAASAIRFLELGYDFTIGKNDEFSFLLQFELLKTAIILGKEKQDIEYFKWVISWLKHISNPYNSLELECLLAEGFAIVDMPSDAKEHLDKALTLILDLQSTQLKISGTELSLVPLIAIGEIVNTEKVFNQHMRLILNQKNLEEPTLINLFENAVLLSKAFSNKSFMNAAYSGIQSYPKSRLMESSLNNRFPKYYIDYSITQKDLNSLYVAINLSSNIHDDYWKSQLFRQISFAGAQLIFLTNDISLVNKVKSIIKNIKDDYDRASALKELVSALSDLASHQENPELLLLAEEIAMEINEVELSSKAFEKLAYSASHLAKLELSMYYLSKSISKSKSIILAEDRHHIQISLVNTANEIAVETKEIQFLDLGKEVAQMITDPFITSKGLSQIVYSLCTLAEEYKDKIFLERAEDIIKILDDKKMKALAFSLLIKSAHRIEDQTTEEHIVFEAQELILDIEDPIEKAHTIRIVVKALAFVEKWKLAIELADQIPDNNNKSIVYSDILRIWHERYNPILE